MTVIINGTAGITFPDGVTQTDGLVTPVPATDGGTGLSSPGTSGNVLTSNGTAWVSAAAGGGLTNNTRQAVTSSSTTTINVNSGNVVDLTMAANITTLSFTNVPASGTPIELLIVVRNAADGTAYTINWPSSIYWNATTADGTLIAPTLATGANGITVISLLTTDGGTKFRGWVDSNLPGSAGGNTLFTWGYNTAYGVLGQNNVINISSPTQVGSLTNWAQVSMGRTSCAAITNTGTLFTWGRGNYGTLGANNAINRSSPVQVGSNTNWAQVSMGGFTCAAVTTAGTLFAWGSAYNGETGQNNRITTSSPVQVGSLTTWARVASGYSFVAALTTAGTLFTWGRNDDGRLGLNDRVNRSSPTQVGSGTNWAQISAGIDSQTCCGGITTDGRLFMWGPNGYGRLGLGDENGRSSPTQVGSNTNWSRISAGQCCAGITTAGTLFMWGYNNRGSLGQNDTIARSSPVQVGSLTTWAEARTDTHCVARTTSGTLWAWGNGASGQLGQNSSASFSSPVQIGSATNWSQISAGRSTSTGLRSSPSVNPA